MSIDMGFKKAPLEQRLDYLGQTTARGSKEMREAAKAIRDKDAEIAKMRKALMRISNHVDCGCVPCTGNCRNIEALKIELKARQEEARAALQTKEGAK